MPKWVYPLAFLFVLFLIFNDPSGAGDRAGDFAGFIVDLLGAVGEFLTGLFEGASSGSSTSTGTTPSTTVDTGSILDADSYTHTHDGSTHTHTSS